MKASRNSQNEAAGSKFIFNAQELPVSTNWAAQLVITEQDKQPIMSTLNIYNQ